MRTPTAARARSPAALEGAKQRKSGKSTGEIARKDDFEAQGPATCCVCGAPTATTVLETPRSSYNAG